MNIKNTIAITVTAVTMLTGCAGVAVKNLAASRGVAELSSSFVRPTRINGLNTQFIGRPVRLTIRARLIPPQLKVQSLELFQKTNKLIAEQVPKLTAELLAIKGVVSSSQYRLTISPSQGFIANVYPNTSAQFFYYADLRDSENRRVWYAVISIPVGGESDVTAAPEFLAEAIVHKLASHGWVQSDPGDPPVDLTFKPDWRESPTQAKRQ